MASVYDELKILEARVEDLEDASMAIQMQNTALQVVVILTIAGEPISESSVKAVAEDLWTRNGIEPPPEFKELVVNLAVGVRDFAGRLTGTKH